MRWSRSGRSAHADPARAPRTGWSGHLDLREANAFTLLRFLAATLVMFGHTEPILGRPGPERTLLGASYGTIAVDVFFVMSGYLIAAAWQRRSSAWQYARNRALRIVPGYAGVVVVTVFVLGPLLTTLPLDAYFRSEITWAYLRNPTFTTIRFDLPGVFTSNPLANVVNGSLWTLPIEAAMYVMLPVIGLLGLLHRRRLPIVIGVLALVDYFAEDRLVANDVTLLGIMPAAATLRFAIFFALGALAWLWSDVLLLRGDVAAGLWLLTWILQPSTAGRVAFAIALTYTVLLAARCPWSWARSFGRRRDLSYGLYLYAFPIQQCVVLAGGRALPVAVHLAGSLVLALGCAALSWRWIERPALALKGRGLHAPAAWRRCGARRVANLLCASVAVACALSACGRSSRTTACVAGAACAEWAPFTAEDLVHAPEVCRNELATALTRDGRLDGGAVAVTVAPWSAEPARRRITAYSLARALTGLARELPDPADRVLAVVDATALDHGCSASDVVDLARELARMVSSPAPGVAADAPAPTRAAVELFCRPGRDEDQLDRRAALLWRVAAEARDGGQPCGVVRADGTCSEGALVDLDRSTMRAGSRTARARAGSVGGFVWSSTAPDQVLRNERFALGLASWESAGEVALRSAGGAPPDRCAPLAVHLGPGASLRQTLQPRGGEARSHARRSRSSATLAIAVEPASAARALELSVDAARSRLPISAGATEIETTLPAERRVRAIELGVALDATEQVTLRGVRIAADSDLREVQSASRRERALSWFAARAAQPGGAGDAPELRERPLDLAAALEDGRVLRSDEDFVRVERFGSDDPSLRSGILAHPGTEQPTRLEFDVPAAACPRRFTARVALAPDCRATSDGVLFRATSGERSTTVTLGGAGGVTAAQPAPIALQLDADADVDATETRRARDAFAARTLVLETESGAAHDTRCDWAVWVEPTVACSDAAATAPSAIGSTAAQAATPAPRTITIPAGEGTRIETAWDEINAWKLYAFFGPMGAKARQASRQPDWLVRRLPWLSHVRVLAALGGNTCRHIRPACERSERTADHPFDPPCWEGKDGRATAYELLHDDDPPRLDASVWGAALDDLLRGGVKPHLNLSAAPCLLTGGEHHYRDYHWNQVPVADRAGYDDLLRAFASEARRRGAGPEWRLSIVNEPNCLWIAPPPGSRADAVPEIAHIGFLGDAPTYAAHFASTARLLRELLPGVRLHIGNFTIGGKYPLEDNLAEYLGVLAPALQQAQVPADELSAISFSIYESPQHGLDDLPAYKFGIVDRARPPGSPFRDLPIKLDEVEIHPLVAEEFESATGGDVDPTRWAAAWHADMLAMALDTGVRSLAPWLGRLIPDDELERPFAKYWVYALLSLATGQAIAGDGALGEVTALRAPAERGSDDAPRLLALHRASDDRDGLGWLATREPKSGVTWVALWRHAHTPLADAAADAMPPLDVSITGEVGPSLGRIGDPVAALSIGPVSALDVARGAPPTGARPWLLAPFRTTAVQSWQVPLGQQGVRLALGQEAIVLLRFAPRHRDDAAPQPPAHEDAPRDAAPDLPEAT